MKPETCSNCGVCCLGQNLLPMHDDTEDDVNPRLSAAALRLFRRIADGPLSGDDSFPCIWFSRDTGLCRFYVLRPTTCRTFERGGKDCLRLRKEYGIDDEH